MAPNPKNHPDPAVIAIREALSRRIREAMHAHGMSGAELARSLGVSQPTVHAWSHAGHGLRRQNIRRLAAVLRVDPAWLEYGTAQGQDAHATGVEEMAFLRLFRDLDTEGRAVTLRLLAALARSPAKV